MPLWALVEYRGRKSGRSYTTPIAIVGFTPRSGYIALPWGRGTDWVRNLQAAGEGKLMWKERPLPSPNPGSLTSRDPRRGAGTAAQDRRSLVARGLPAAALGTEHLTGRVRAASLPPARDPARCVPRQAAG